MDCPEAAKVCSWSCSDVPELNSGKTERSLYRASSDKFIINFRGKKKKQSCLQKVNITWDQQPTALYRDILQVCLSPPCLHREDGIREEAVDTWGQSWIQKPVKSNVMFSAAVTSLWYKVLKLTFKKHNIQSKGESGDLSNHVKSLHKSVSITYEPACVSFRTESGQYILLLYLILMLCICQKLQCRFLEGCILLNIRSNQRCEHFIMSYT